MDARYPEADENGDQTLAGNLKVLMRQFAPPKKLGVKTQGRK